MIKTGYENLFLFQIHKEKNIYTYLLCGSLYANRFFCVNMIRITKMGKIVLFIPYHIYLRRLLYEHYFSSER